MAFNKRIKRDARTSRALYAGVKLNRGVLEFMNKILLLLLFGVSVSASAGSVSQGSITKIMVDTSRGEIIFIQVSGPLADAPSCSTNGAWQFVLPLNTELKKDTMTSFLLGAHMANKKVRLDGNGTCDSYSSIETLKRIEFLE